MYIEVVSSGMVEKMGVPVKHLFGYRLEAFGIGKLSIVLFNGEEGESNWDFCTYNLYTILLT